MKTLTREEVSKMTGIDVHLFKDLQNSGLLAGVKVGKGYRYDEEQVDEFQRKIRGHDVSNSRMIWRTASLLNQKENGA